MRPRCAPAPRRRAGPSRGVAPDEVRALLRDPRGPPVGPAERAAGLQEHARAGGARRPHGLRLLLDRRAPLPRGVLALLEPRGALRRGGGAYLADPNRLRRAPRAAALQPPGALGGVRGRARPDLRRARRVRHGAVEHAPRDGGVRDPPERDALDVGGGGAPRRALLDRGGERVRGPLLEAPAAARAAEAPPAAPPAGLGSHGQPRGPPHDGRARPRPPLLQRRDPAGGAQAADRPLPPRPRGPPRAA